MSKLLEYSTFNQVLFPPEADEAASQDLSLRRALNYGVSPTDLVKDIPWVVFDFETTGLNSHNDRIIELGALKMVNGEVVDEISTLIEVDIPIPEVVQKITGITPDMLVGQPRIETFLKNSLSLSREVSLSRITQNSIWPSYQLKLEDLVTILTGLVSVL